MTSSALQAQFGAADGESVGDFHVSARVRSSTRHPRSTSFFLFLTAHLPRVSKCDCLRNDRLAWLRLGRHGRRFVQHVVAVFSHRPPSSLVPPLCQGQSCAHGTLDCHVAVRPRRARIFPALCARRLRVLCPLPKDPPPPLRHRESAHARTSGSIGADPRPVSIARRSTLEPQAARSHRRHRRGLDRCRQRRQLHRPRL